MNLPDRDPFYSMHPTSSEALQMARDINRIIDPETRTTNLLLLNHSTEDAVGMSDVYAGGYFAAVPPSEITYSENEDPSTPLMGRFEGFQDIPVVQTDSVGIDIISNEVCVKLYQGIANFISSVTKGVYERNLFLPVDDVTQLIPYQELSNLMTNPNEVTTTSVDYSAVHQAVKENIRNVKKNIPRETVYQSLYTEEIEPWDCFGASPIPLQVLRTCEIGVRAEFGVAVVTDKNKRSHQVALKDYIFDGFYIGTSGLISIKGYTKPHFVFEVSSTQNMSCAPTKNIPHIYVPVSDEISLEIGYPGEFFDDF